MDGSEAEQGQRPLVESPSEDSDISHTQDSVDQLLNAETLQFEIRKYVPLVHCLFSAEIYGAINWDSDYIVSIWVVTNGEYYSIMTVCVCVCVCVCVLTWTPCGMYIRLNVCITYVQPLYCRPLSLGVRIIHTTHLTVVEGAPSSRNQSFLGKAVCVLCFIWLTHSLSGVLFKINRIASQ